MKKNYNYKIFIGIIVGIILSTIIAYATITHYAEDIFYNSENSNNFANNVQDALDALASSCENTCPPYKTCVSLPNVSVGDYISYTPPKTSYTTSTEFTGYTSTQTINPSEINKWRVIKVNMDGTVEIIGHYVSSNLIHFTGQTGYKYFVGYLNEIARQYENSTYTIGSRHFGYNGTQTEFITDTSKFTTSAPWTCNTGASCKPVERQGGGDTGYNTDYNLVKAIYNNSVKATRPNGTSCDYWVASRNYVYSSATNFGWYARNTYHFTVNANLIISNGSTLTNATNGWAIRPIVILKAGLRYSGSGTENSPKTISVS